MNCKKIVTAGCELQSGSITKIQPCTAAVGIVDQCKNELLHKLVTGRVDDEEEFGLK